MKEYLLRSLMFVPSHNDKLMISASKSVADVLLLDIEDSVQPNANKQVARDKILEYAENQFFVVERTYQSGYGMDGNIIRIFDVIIDDTATNILDKQSLRMSEYTTVKKELLLDFTTIKKQLKL